MIFYLTHSLLRLLELVVQILLQNKQPLGRHTGLHGSVHLRRKSLHLQEVGGGLRQLIGQKLEVILVELALQMGVHVLAVEGAELADGAGEYHPGKRRAGEPQTAQGIHTQHGPQRT